MPSSPAIVRVLFVEDRPELIHDDILELMKDKPDWELDRAYNIVEAWSLLCKKKYHLVIADVMLAQYGDVPRHFEGLYLLAWLIEGHLYREELKPPEGNLQKKYPPREVLCYTHRNTDTVRLKLDTILAADNSGRKASATIQVLDRLSEPGPDLYSIIIERLSSCE